MEPIQPHSKWEPSPQLARAHSMAGTNCQVIQAQSGMRRPPLSRGFALAKEDGASSNALQPFRQAEKQRKSHPTIQQQIHHGLGRGQT